MRTKFLQCLVVIVVAFLILTVPAYRRHSNLVSTNHFSAEFSFENSDGSDQSSDQRRDESRAFVLGDCPLLLTGIANHSQSTLCVTVPTSFPDQETSLLRC